MYLCTVNNYKELNFIKMDKDKLKISELQKEIQELKEENKNLNWMIEKQFEHSFKQIKKTK